MARIRAGIIGAGFISALHVDALRRLGYVDIVALAGEGDAETQTRAAALGIPRAYGDYRDLLADRDVQVVHDCTPNWLHFEINRAVLECGKHLLSEKPLAVNSEQSSALVRLARDLPVVSAVNFNHRAYPHVREARSMVQSGRLGRVTLAHGGYFQDWLLLPSDYNWRIDPDLGGPSRAVADIGSHWYDLLRYITGLRAEGVFAELRTVHPLRERLAPQGTQTFAGSDIRSAGGGTADTVQVRTEDAASVVLRLTGGALASFVVSQVSPGRKNRLLMEVAGTEASVSWDGETPEYLWVGHRDAANEIRLRDPNLMDPAVRAATRLPAGHPEGWADALLTNIKDVYDFIAAGGDPRTDRPPFASFADGHETMLMVEAVLRSHAEGRWVRLDGEMIE